MLQDNPRGTGWRTALGALLSCALLILVLAGCSSIASSVAPYDASELSRNPRLIVATTRKPLNSARAKPWFGTERASALTFARGKLVPPDDGRFSLSSIGLGDWSLEGIEPVARLSDLLPPGGEPRDVLLYVHGFNTTFETAVLDAARLQVFSVGRDGSGGLEAPVFSVDEDDPDAPKGRREVARSGMRQADFVLPPGTYYVVARQGNIEARERLALVRRRWLSADSISSTPS